MIRLLRRRPPAKHRAPRTSRGRHRLHRLHRSHRRIGYVTVGALAITGTVAAGAPVLARTRGTASLTTRPVAAPAEPATRVVRRERASRSVTRRPAYKWVVRMVPGQVLHGRATWYGPGFAGHGTANGEVFDPASLTAAHRTLPFGTLLNVCLRGRCVVVRINDRGPFGNAILDLSREAGERIGLIGPGIAEVTATVLRPTRVRVPA